MASRYQEIYDGWKRNPDAFWGGAAKAIDWFRPADKVFDASLGAYGRWFPGAKVNTCHNAVDRHVASGRGDQAAVIYDSPVTGTKQIFSYADLLTEVQALAASIRDLGVGKGDRVIIYMPMVPQAVVCDACLRPAWRNPFGGVRRLCRA